MQQKVQSHLAEIQKLSWVNKERLENLGEGVRRAVEAGRKGREEEQEHRRQGEQIKTQDRSTASKASKSWKTYERKAQTSRR